METPELIAACWTTAGDAAPLRGDEVSPFPIRDRIRAAADAGWQGVGINYSDLLPARSDPGWPTLRSMLDDYGITHLELEFLNDWWTVGDHRISSDAMRSDLLSAAEILGARHVKAGADLNGPAPDSDRLAGDFEKLCRQAADVGTRIALEPMPWSIFPTIEAGFRFVKSVGHPAGGLCVDIWHCYRGGNVPSDLLAFLTPDLVFAVELDDGDQDVVGSLFEDTIDNRRLCGRGVWDVPAFITTMRSVGFDGPWGVEIISAEHRKRPLEEAVRIARDTTLEQFAATSGGS